MKTISRCTLALASFLLLTGCAATTQSVHFPTQTKKIEDSNKARIYVMRPAWVGTAVSISVNDSGMHIGNTGPKGYLCWERTPGQAAITSEAENSSVLNLCTEKGGVYYLFQHLSPGLLGPRTRLELVNEAEGSEVLSGCHPPEASGR